MTIDIGAWADTAGLSALRHVIRSAWGIKARLIACASIAGFAMGVYAGAMSAIDSLIASRNMWYEEGNLADMELRFGGEDTLNIPDFSSLDFVDGVSLRAIYPGSVKTKDGSNLKLACIFTHTGAAGINKLKLIEGRSLDGAGSGEAVVESAMRRYYGVKPGDKLDISMGKDNYHVKVRGVSQAAEFILAPANPSLFIPTKGSLGVVYMSPKALEEHYGFQIANSALFRFKTGTDLEMARAKIREFAAKRLNVDSTTGRTEQFSYQFMEKDLGVFRVVLPAIVTVCAISSAMVTIFLFFQWIQRERQTIGVFLAMGYSPAGISSAFLVAFITLAALAILEGLAFGVVVMNGFGINFAESIGLPPPSLRLTPMRAIEGALGVVAIFMTASHLSMRKISSITPKDAMRVPGLLPVKMGKIELAIGNMAGAIWLRLAIRNVLRHRTVSGMTALAAAMGFGVTASYFISFSSFVGTSTRSVDRDAWDLAVDFSAPVWQEDLAKYQAIEGVKEIVPYTKGVGQAIKGNVRQNIYIAGVDTTRLMRKVKMISGENLKASGADAILMEKSTAELLGLKAGGNVDVEIAGTKRTLAVRGLFSGALPGEAYMPIETHRGMADLSERSTGLFVTITGSPKEIAEKFYAMPDVQQVLSKNKVASEIIKASDQVTQIINLGAMVGLTTALLFVFTCVAYAVAQRSHEYGTLRLLGYSDRLIICIIVAEVCLLGLASTAGAAPIGYVVAEYMNSRLSSAWFDVDTIVTPLDYLKILVPGFLLMPAAAFPAALGVVGEPLQNMLKERKIA